MFHFGFIVEQTLGHVTHGMNLREHIARDPTIQAEWGLPAWNDDKLLAKIPVLRRNWTLQAGLRTRVILRDLERRSRKLDALFFHTQVTAVLSPDWLRRIPSIVSLDCTPLQYDRLGTFYHHPTGPAWLENLKWRLNRDCFRLARHLVTWSEWTKQGLVDEYEVPADKISVIPPGVNTRAWAAPEARTGKLDPVRILFVGGDLERKGGRILLESFRQLHAQVPSLSIDHGRTSIELHLVTQAPVTPEPGVFVYSDLQPNSEKLKELFFKSDIFCLPTLGDCLAMVLAEAGAAGLPTVSTHVAGIPEIIKDEETGFLVPPGDVAALTQALARLIQEPLLRLRQGQAAQRIVGQRFDANRNAEQLLDLMKHISATT